MARNIILRLGSGEAGKVADALANGKLFAEAGHDSNTATTLNGIRERLWKAADRVRASGSGKE